MHARGRDGRAHDLKTITKRKTRKVWFGEVGEAEVEAAAAAAEGLLLLCAWEVVVKAPSRAADRQDGGRFEMEAQRRATCSELGSLLSEMEKGAKKSDLLGAFPLCNLPEELQLIVAAQVAAPRDRAALCIADPPLGRKAIKAIKAYQVPLMSLGFRVLSGGAVSEAEVRTFVRKFAPSEAAHPSLALNEYAQLNAIAAPSARVRCVTEGSNLEWRLESGALLRSWKPLEGMTNLRRNRAAPGMHHYVGAAGAERLVSLVFADGDVLDFRGERGAEVLWQRRSSGGFYKNIDIPGWWGRGLWLPSTNSSAWKLMTATLSCAAGTHCRISLRDDPLRDDPLRHIYLPGHPFLHPTYLLRIHHT